jgi:hypothetical protein
MLLHSCYVISQINKSLVQSLQPNNVPICLTSVVKGIPYERPCQHSFPHIRPPPSMLHIRQLMDRCVCVQCSVCACGSIVCDFCVCVFRLILSCISCYLHTLTHIFLVGLCVLARRISQAPILIHICMVCVFVIDGQGVCCEWPSLILHV